MKIARFIADGQLLEGSYEEGELVAAGRRYDPAQVRWLPPVDPPKVIGLALNYADHLAELSKVDLPAEQAQTIKKAPALFFKPRTALIGHGEAIRYPSGVEYMHYEGELAVVIGRGGRRIKAADALGHVKGFTIANDVTVRDFVQNFYRPPVKAKGWDTFGPLGPIMVSADELGDGTGLALRTLVNGELRQQGNTSDLIYSIPEIIAFVSEFMTLEENDVLLTGTPQGISPIHPGDVVRVEIEGIGALENPVIGDR